MLTINQIVNKLNLIQVNHAQLNSFHFGDPWELEASENLQYPVFITALLPGALSKRTQTVKLYLAVADLVSRGEENETEVLSDTQLILMDAYAQLWEYLEENSIQLSSEATFSPFTEKWDNAVSGWQLEVDLTQFYSRDACQVPLRGIDSEFTQPAQLLTSIGHEGTLFEIPNDGSDSSLFRIIGYGLLPDSGNITITYPPDIEFYNGSAWVASPTSVPYINGVFLSQQIYKFRMINYSAISSVVFETENLTYNLTITAS